MYFVKKKKTKQKNIVFWKTQLRKYSFIKYFSEHIETAVRGLHAALLRRDSNTDVFL